MFTVANGVSDPKFPFSRPSGTAPPAEYAKLRKECPLSRVRLWDDSKMWMVVRHKDVCDVLGDPRFSKVRTHPGFPELTSGGKAAAAHRATYVDMDAPEHTKQRGMVEPMFDRKNIDSLRPSFQKTVDECLEEMIKVGCQEPVDLVEEFALRVPTQIIYRLMGIPEKDMDFLTSKNAVRTSASGTAGDKSAASKDLNEYISKLVESKVKEPKDDLISKLVVEQMNTGNLDHEDVVQLTFLHLVAGNATMVNLIALGVVELLQHPQQLEDMKKEPKLVEPMVEELLRYHTSSALATRRVADQDVELLGQVVQKNEGIYASNMSANRDESVFKDPDTFDIHRSPGPQLGFGYGAHVCVARWLARAELQCVFGTIFQKLPNLKLAVPFDEVKYSEPDQDVGITELPVTW